MVFSGRCRGDRLPAISVLLLASSVIAPGRAQDPFAVAVNTTSMVLDGVTSNVEALKANPGSDGKISLVEAVTAVNNSGSGFTIGFDLPHGAAIYTGFGTLSIEASRTTVDGDTDLDSRPDVLIYGPDRVVSLFVRADTVVIRNLAISGLRFTGENTFDGRVENCFIGTDIDGKAAGPGTGNGMEIRDSAHHITIERCIISGNVVPDPNWSSVGLFIYRGSHHNTVTNCRIGVSIDGTALPNEIGIELGAGSGPATDNIIGGARPPTGDLGPGNVISGNTEDGIILYGAGTSGNLIQGNFIGLDPTGTTAMPNSVTGYQAVSIFGGASNNTVGGERTTPLGGPGNVISGNTSDGVWIAGAATIGNKVQGNVIGTNASGTSAVPNGAAGIRLVEGTAANIIGATTPASGLPTFGNLVSGNNGPGVFVGGATTRRNTIRGNAIHSNAGRGIDLSGSDRPAGDFITPNDETDLDTGPNDLINFPVGVTARFDTHRNKTTISGILPTFSPSTALVDVYAVAAVDASGFGEGEIYIGSATPHPSGPFRLEIPGRLPATFPFLSATATDAVGNTSEFSPVCGDPDLDGNPDSDGDGLCDDWEMKGIDYDGDGTVDLALHQPPFSADPRHKDIFLEIDYMEATDHTHRPAERPDKTGLPTNPIALVTAAFAAAPVVNPDSLPGIRLHAMEDESIPEVPILRFLTRGPNPDDDFEDLKLGVPPDPRNGRFGTDAERTSANVANILGARRLVFRYCLFGHEAFEGGGASGIAEAGGNDFMVTLRSRVPNVIDYEDVAIAVANQFAIPFYQEWTDTVAGVFMHELGHTLGLQHGGGEGIPDAQAANRMVNGKPNYLSVMNYARQFNLAGEAKGLPGITDGTLVRTERKIDYSPTALPALNEQSLNELDGIQGPVGERTRFGAVGNAYISPSDGPIDWDDNGAIQAGVSSDVNFIMNEPEYPRSPGQVLNGHDDWSNLIYSFRSSVDFADGSRLTAADQKEPTPLDYLIGNMGGLPSLADTLRIVGGIRSVTPLELMVLDLETTGTSAGRIDLPDAVRRARQAAGLDL